MTVYCSDTTNCSSAYQTLATDVMPQLPGALPDVINLEIKEVLRIFFRASRVWREDIGPFTVRANRNIVALNPIRANAIVFAIDKDQPVYLDSDDGRHYLYGKKFSRGSFQTPTALRPIYWNMRTPGELGIAPTPTETYSRQLYCTGILRPATDAAYIPDFVLDTYRDILIHGTLGRLMAHPNKPYSSTTLAAMHLAAFHGGIPTPRADADTAGQGSPEWSYPRFA